MRFRLPVALTPCLLVLSLVARSLAQSYVAPGPLPEPVNGTAPLLHVRLLGPPEMEATFYRGFDRGSRFPMPVTVALRPGYIYRVELDQLPNHPGISLFPTLEVIGTLRLPPRVRASQFPAPILLTTDDVEQVLAGAFITKVVYLENPDMAAPGSSNPDLPTETLLPLSRDLIREASDNGRPLIVLRMGQREVTPEDMARQAIPGTLMLPGETHLSLPRQKPVIPPVTWQWYDPTLGPRKPEEFYLYNGYLNPNRGFAFPGIDHEGRLQGVRPEDTVAEFTDSGGRRNVVTSNRVCLVVPRFALLRNELPLNQYDSVTTVVDGRTVTGQNAPRGRLPLAQATADETLVAFAGRERPSGATNKEGLGRILRLEALHGDQIYLGTGAVLGTAEVAKLTEIDRLRLTRQIRFALALSQGEHVSGFENVIAPLVVARIQGGPEVVRATAETRDVSSICLKEPPQAPDKPLTLIKWADRESARVGDVVTFFLRYSCHGHYPLTDVAVTDSLTTRLEYITGSSQSNRPAVFTMQENEAGSLILRWEITGNLIPGDNGVIRFQARVR